MEIKCRMKNKRTTYKKYCTSIQVTARLHPARNPENKKNIYDGVQL